MPATAWLPLIFFIFPTSASASVFVIALASSFPVAVLTWSGVASVNRDYYDIARTLGASERFLILKVAMPAALPHVFVGLFMGLGLVVRRARRRRDARREVRARLVPELGAGLGRLRQPLCARCCVMALACSTLITLLFRVRDRLLSWQKGMVRW